MGGKRRRFTPQFKARVALEALREWESVNAIVAGHELHTKIGELAVDRDFVRRGLGR